MRYVSFWSHPLWCSGGVLANTVELYSHNTRRERSFGDWLPLSGERELNSLARCWDVPLGHCRQGLASGQQKPRLMIASTRLSYQELGQTLMNRRAPTSCKAI